MRKLKERRHRDVKTGSILVGMEKGRKVSVFSCYRHETLADKAIAEALEKAGDLPTNKEKQA